MRWTADELAEQGLSALSGELSREDGFVVVQGIVDMACLRTDGIRIVDFKTDRVRSEQDVREKVRIYEPQLRLYASALSRIHGRPVTDAWLHFLPMNLSVSVNLNRI